MLKSLTLLFVLLGINLASAEDVLIAPFFKNLQEGKKQTVVLYGTSLTFYGAWSVMIKDWLDAKYPGQVTLINSGGPGQNSTWGLANLKAKVLDQKPDLVFIEFAYNDSVTRFNLPVDKAAQNLDAMVTAIRAQNGDAQIVLQTMNVPWDSPSTAALSKRPNLEAYNDNYRQYAKTHGLPLLDHYPAWKHFEDTQPDQYHADVPDGTHPNKSGILVAMWPALQEFLEKSNAAAGGK
jgi:acyl-CoA thioesterase-1